MSRLRRRPVVYRSQVCMWLAIVLIATAVTVVFVPGTGQRVTAFALLGVAAATAAAVWRVSEYRIHLVGPPTSSGSRAWILVLVAVCFAVARIVGDEGPFMAGVAGYGVGLALTLPVFTYATALDQPPPDEADRPTDRR